MTSDQILLVKLLTDLIFTASTTLARISKMSEEEVKAEIPRAEATTAKLMGDLRGH